MKAAVALTAMFAGLCATGMAAPLTQEIRSNPEFLTIDPTVLPLSGLLPTGFDQTVSDQTWSDKARDLTVALTIDDALAQDPTSLDRPQVAGSVRVPQPFATVAVGFIMIALFGIYRLNYRINRNGRRHRNQMRQLTVLR
jgi:hypothetical protein